MSGLFQQPARWLFQQSALAVRHGLIKFPVLLVPTRDVPREIQLRWPFRESFESHLAQLELLSPLSHQYPFLIIGYSSQAIIGDPCIYELEEDTYAANTNAVIDRFIEFPPEYHQAGLNILSFFGTYLREQYPDQSATVKIEQHGLKVRMVIESSDGRTETIEKALHEYELIVTGQEPPEKFARSDKLILELNNELRISRFRIESQQELIGMQNKRIDQLLSIVGDGLAQRNNVAIDFSPEITLTNTVSINQNVASALCSINELLENLPMANDAYLALKELEGSLEKIEPCTEPTEIRRSPAMSKFRRLIENVVDEGSELNAAINKAESGWEIFSDIASKYNKIAEWCGLPVIPSALLKTA